MKCASCLQEKDILTEREVRGKKIWVCDSCLFLIEGLKANPEYDYQFTVGRDIVLELKDYVIVGAYKKSTDTSIHPKVWSGLSNTWAIITVLTSAVWSCFGCGYTIYKPCTDKPAGKINSYCYCSHCWEIETSKKIRKCGICGLPLNECTC
jgi:ribosomal protein L37AE/L43A